MDREWDWDTEQSRSAALTATAEVFSFLCIDRNVGVGCGILRNSKQSPLFSGCRSVKE
jgi:hypothetical protein